MYVELLLTITVTLSVYLYFFAKSRYRFFKDKGMRSMPVVPFFGNMMASTLRLKHLVYTFDDIYKTFPAERIVGFFEFFNPMYMIRDPDLLKQITVKDFDHFVDHRSILPDEPNQADSIFSTTLFALKGDKWRDMRSTLSPAFTSSKMRNMCPFMVECGHQVVSYLKKEAASTKSKNGCLEIEMKDLYTRFATDVIATSAFGCKTDSLMDRENEFFVTGKRIGAFTFSKFIKMLIILNCPKIASILDISLMNPEVTNFFKNIYESTVKYREENKIFRPDMINILMEVKKGSLKYDTQTATDEIGFATVEESDIGKRQSKRAWTDEELASQAFLFFFAGFDTISAALSFASLELVANPLIQDKLREEIDANYPENGDLTYESIQKLTYLDMVVSECLRLWAPFPSSDRVCVRAYNVPDKDGKKTNVVIEKGKVCIIPIRQLHHDPLYWDEPEKFDPERFSAENKHKINPFTYMPFGLGPRNCIGSRFALMEVKVILFYLIRNFKFTPCPKTLNPIVLPKTTIAMTLPDGFWINMTPRKV